MKRIVVLVHCQLLPELRQEINFHFFVIAVYGSR